MESNQTETNKMALTSAISAGVAWVIGGLGTCGSFFLFPPLAICTGIIFFVGSLAAAITGYLGRNQIRDSGGAQTGEGLAMTGLVLGGIGTVLAICTVVAAILITILIGPAIANVFSNIFLTPP